MDRGNSMIKKLDTPTQIETTLDKIPRGQGGWITKISGPEAVVCRMLEMGLVEEAYVEMAHEAPFGSDPVAIKVRGGLLALRRSEAKLINVRRVPVL